MDINLNSNLPYFGEYEVKIKNIETGEIKKEQLKNMIMDVGLDELMRPLYSDVSSSIEASNFKIAYLAVGTDATANSSASSRLFAEVFRTTPSVAPYRYDIGQVATEFVLFSADANVRIREIGIFCSSIASSSADTGIMLSRVIWDHTKTSLEEITFTRIDRVSRP